MTQYFIVGGAGFIGSHLATTLLREEPEARVTVFDNFSSGHAWHLPRPELTGGRLVVIRGDAGDLPTLTAAMAGHDHVYHFAANPDLARAAREPSIDFFEGTSLTHNVCEAARRAGVARITYASGSGVYGDAREEPVHENFAPLRPVSTYGASKLAGEAMVCAYAAMFGVRGRALRFANVVGPRQTHGVAYDFVRRLLDDPTELPIRGDGRQSKSYLHVDDAVAAMRLESLWQDAAPFDVFNAATQDYFTVRQIADLVCGRLGLANVPYRFAGGAAGWNGDVPVVRFDSRKLRALGWSNRRTTTEALADAIDAITADARAGRLATSA